jgi:hypothetical protein
MLQLTAVPGSQPVDGIIALSLGSDLAAEGVGGGGVEGTAVGIDVSNGDLDRSVILGGDQAVCNRRSRSDSSKSKSRIIGAKNALVAAHLRGT